MTEIISVLQEQGVVPVHIIPVLMVLFVVNIFMSRTLMKVQGYANLTYHTNKVVWFSIFTGVIPVTIVLYFIIRGHKAKKAAAEAKAKAEAEALEAELEERKRYWNSPEGKAAAIREEIREEKEFARKKLLDDLTDISGVSDKISRTILDQYPTIESIKSATEEKLMEIPGVGKGLAKAIKARIG